MDNSSRAKATILQGLSEKEAKEGFLRSGPNLIPDTQARTILDIIKDTMHEPTFVLLLLAACLYLIFGDIGQGLFISAGPLFHWNWTHGANACCSLYAWGGQE